MWLPLGLPTVAQAVPELRCHFEVNAERFEHRFKPVSEPYTVQSINLADRFRFKAVVLGNDTRCLLYTSPSPRDYAASRMPSSA